MLEFLTEGTRMIQWEGFRANLHNFKMIQKKLPRVVKSLTEDQIKQLYSYIIINRIFDDYEVYDDTGQVPKNNEEVVSFIVAVSAYMSTLKKAVEDLRKDDEKKAAGVIGSQKLDVELEKKLNEVHTWMTESQEKQEEKRIGLRVIALFYSYVTNSKEIYTPRKRDWKKVAFINGYKAETIGHNLYKFYNEYSSKDKRINIKKNTKSDNSHWRRFEKIISELGTYPKERDKAEEEFELFRETYLEHYGKPYVVDPKWLEKNSIHIHLYTPL